MSEVHKPVEGTPLAASTAAEQVHAPVTEATADPIRPTGTDGLVAESRPEVAAADTTTAGHHTEGAVVDANEERLGDNEVAVTAQPVAEGVLGYKAPGLVK